jgi:hypothetical protein
VTERKMLVCDIQGVGDMWTGEFSIVLVSPPRREKRKYRTPT